MFSKHRVVGVLHTYPNLLSDANGVGPNKPPYFPITTAALLLAVQTESGLAGSPDFDRRPDNGLWQAFRG